MIPLGPAVGGREELHAQMNIISLEAMVLRAKADLLYERDMRNATDCDISDLETARQHLRDTYILLKRT